MTEVDAVESEPIEKNKRKRKKLLCSQIRQQMEFYFSDANLHKDRFLMQLISQNADGYVELEIFAKFNKITSMTTDMDLVAKALSSSEHLKISQDKKMVKRSTPILPPKDIDARTVYVECIPQATDHEWLKRTFSECGNVLYVSLPKYKSSGDIKGFAFIEFDTTEGARRACEMLNNPPSGAEKPGKFPKASKQQYHLQRQTQRATGQTRIDLPTTPVLEGKMCQLGRRKRRRTNSDNTADCTSSKVRKRSSASECSTGSCQSSVIESDTEKPTMDTNQSDDEDSSKLKRKLDNTDNEDLDTVPAKILKLTGNVSHKEQEPNSKHIILDVESPTKRKVEKDAQKKVRISDKHEVREMEAKKKKRKKNKKKKKEQRKDLPELRVIPKKEWLSLREEYLTLQKVSVNKLKSALNIYKKSVNSSPKKGTPLDNLEKDKHDAPKEKSDLQFTPDVIVQVVGTKPLYRKELKDSLSSISDIAYIDILDSDLKGYVRCKSSQAALTLSELQIEEIKLELLQGDHEKNYWEKIQADREKKLSTKRKQKRRGKEKIVQKVENAVKHASKTHHVVFDD